MIKELIIFLTKIIGLMVTSVFMLGWLFFSLGFIENMGGFAFGRSVINKFNYPISQLTINDILQIVGTLIAALILFFVILAIAAVILQFGKVIIEKILDNMIR